MQPTTFKVYLMAKLLFFCLFFFSASLSANVIAPEARILTGKLHPLLQEPQVAAPKEAGRLAAHLAKDQSRRSAPKAFQFHWGGFLLGLLLHVVGLLIVLVFIRSKDAILSALIGILVLIVLIFIFTLGLLFSALKK